MAGCGVMIQKNLRYESVKDKGLPTLFNPKKFVF